MAHVSLVMTVIGADRPGLVGQLSSVIADHGGNWLESRMARLGGQFAGILRIELPVEREKDLREALHALETDGLNVHAQRDANPLPTAGHSSGTLELIGHDRPGIISQISQVLAQHQVNVEELTTDRESAPMSGEMLFRANARVQLPASVTLHALRDALEEIASDLMVDVTIKQEHGAH